MNVYFSSLVMKTHGESSFLVNIDIYDRLTWVLYGPGGILGCYATIDPWLVVG